VRAVTGERELAGEDLVAATAGAVDAMREAADELAAVLGALERMGVPGLVAASGLAWAADRVARDAERMLDRARAATPPERVSAAELRAALADLRARRGLGPGGRRRAMLPS